MAKPTLDEKIRLTEKNVARAKEEVLRLKDQLKDKTLNQRTLESGLKNLTKTLNKVPHYWPKHGPNCR